MREYRLPSGDTAADPVEGSGLGLLRDPSVRVLRRGRELVAMTPEIRAFLERPQALIITKANVKSRVHRRAHLDYIGVKLFDEQRAPAAASCASSACSPRAPIPTPPREVPYLRLKVAKVIARAGFDPSSYAGRALLNVLENYPRDELFQIDEDTLYHFAIDIMNLSERPRVRALARVDEFDRFVSVLVFVPKDRYDTQARLRIGEFLACDLRGPHVRLLSGLSGRAARAHALHHRPRRGADAAGGARDPGEGHRRHRPHLERRPARCARRDRRRRARACARLPLRRTPSAPPIARLSAPSRPSPTSRFWSSSRRRGPAPSISTAARATTKHACNLKVFSRGAALPLSERVPLLENLGFRVVNERTYRVAFDASTDRVWLHDMTLERAAGGAIEIDEIQALIEAALLALFRGLAESDGFNRLVLEAGLGWRDVAMVRALGRYLRQIQVTYAQDYIAETLARHGGIAAELVKLFYARFDPRTRRPARAAAEAAIRERDRGTAARTSRASTTTASCAASST